MKKLLYAIRFLTIIPIPWKQDEDMTKVARSMIYFPFVGFLIGLCLSFGEFLLSIYFTPLLVAVFITALWILLTGGLHLDGLSDLADGLGGKSSEQRLEIMKDSRLGAFGALSLISIIILKIVVIREIIIVTNVQDLQFINLKSPFISALIISPMWGRMVELLLIRFYKSARRGGMGSFFKDSIREREWILPLFFSIFITFILINIYSLIIIFFVILLIIVSARSISKKLNGLTGDCYGAFCEISELLVLISILFLNIIK